MHTYSRNKINTEVKSKELNEAYGNCNTGNMKFDQYQNCGY